MKRGGIASVLLLVALAIVSAGCGSDSDTTATVTKAQFDKEAEVVCNSYESEKEEAIVKLQEQFPSSPNAKEQEEIILNILRPYERLVERLADLDLPEGQEQKVEAAIETMEAAAQNAHANPKDLVAGKDVFAEADKQAKALGWENCKA